MVHSIGSELVGLPIKGVLTGNLFSILRNCPALEGQSSRFIKTPKMSQHHKIQKKKKINIFVCMK